MFVVFPPVKSDMVRKVWFFGGCRASGRGWVTFYLGKHLWGITSLRVTIYISLCVIRGSGDICCYCDIVMLLLNIFLCRVRNNIILINCIFVLCGIFILSVIVYKWCHSMKWRWMHDSFNTSLYCIITNTKFALTSFINNTLSI